MMDMETLVGRLMDLETKYYELQDKYHHLINEYEKLKDEHESQRSEKWKDLTDVELQFAWDSMKDYEDYDTFAKTIQKLLKAKNEKNCPGHRNEHGTRYDPFVRNK